MCQFILWIIYVLGMLELFGTESYTWRLDIVKNLFKFWAQNLQIPRIPLIPADQNVSILFVNNIYIYWEYQNSLTRKTIHEDSKKFKNLWILSIFLVWFCRPKMCWYLRGKNILIPPYCILPMLSYCLKCRKDIESKNPNVVKTKNGRIMLLSNCSVSNSKKSRFVKEQEASRLLSSLGIKAPFSRIPLVGPILF